MKYYSTLSLTLGEKQNKEIATKERIRRPQLYQQIIFKNRAWKRKVGFEKKKIFTYPS